MQIPHKKTEKHKKTEEAKGTARQQYGTDQRQLE
jgi:hypothetical protein